jgi:hypothetical protein
MGGAVKSGLSGHCQFHAEDEAVKFHEISIGQRFNFEGDVYVKTGPVMASCERDGSRRLMRRSSQVTLSGDETGAESAETSTSAEALTRERVLTAFEAFSGLCHRCLEDMVEACDQRAVEEARRALQRARNEFIAALSLDDSR